MEQQGKHPVSAALAEDKLFELRKELPSKLITRGHQAGLPSGQKITFSVLVSLAEVAEKSNNWTLPELANALNDPQEHIRCASLALLTKKTGIQENHSSFTMSVDQLKSSGVIKSGRRLPTAQESSPCLAAQGFQIPLNILAPT